MQLLVLLLVVPQVDPQLGDHILGLVELRLPVGQLRLELLLDHRDGLLAESGKYDRNVCNFGALLKSLLRQTVDGICGPLKFPDLVHVGHQSGVELLQGLLVIHLGLGELHHALAGSLKRNRLSRLTEPK